MTGGGFLYLAHKAATAVLGFIGGLFRALRPYSPWLLVAFLGALAWQCTPVFGAGAQLARAKAEAESWATQAQEAQTEAEKHWLAWSESEAARGREWMAAEEAMAQDQVSCLAQVAEARRSARVIEKIVTKEPTYDESRCPRRELVPADQLRDAISPPAG